ncbi:MAG: nucleotidyl transferase AbiEii/AbiGii toxin family protein [Candidatus Aenigmarchaeota archaeon]|nr:nucleotidyl transferase AbiEii/AbiGii toxin family protein [Candidatus Aenigmarchaeota archaeon]
MLTQEEVKSYAHMRRLKLIDQIWKDYFQDLLLYLLYKKMPNMIFGGGTCIWKVFKGNRFSEDIDAYAVKIPVDLSNYLKKELALLGVNCNILKSKRTSNMLFLRLGLSFPVHPREIPLSIEILASSKPKTTEKVTLYSPYPDIPPVEMFVPSKEDMLANKVSAVYQRNRPRDVYDIALLLKLGATVDMKLIKKKIPKFNLNTFKKKLQEKQKAWKSLEPLVVTKLPKFKEQTRYIISFFQS